MADWTGNLSEEELKSMLDVSVRSLLLSIDTSGGDFDQLGAALSFPLTCLGATREPSTYPDFWPKIKREMYILVCKNGSKYSDLRKQLSKGAITVHDVLVAAIAAAISKELGFGPALLTPFIVLCLITVVRVGKEAWCHSFRERENAGEC